LPKDGLRSPFGWMTGSRDWTNGENVIPQRSRMGLTGKEGGDTREYGYEDEVVMGERIVVVVGSV